jgi:hypothetical protein
MYGYSCYMVGVYIYIFLLTFVQHLPLYIILVYLIIIMLSGY